MSELPVPGRPADRPLVTYYDDACGLRVELSAAEVADRAARTARLLRDGCGLGPGDRAAVMLPPHWQTAAVLLGAWSAGLLVSVRLAATAGLPVLGAGADDPIDVTFADRRRIDDWLDDVPEAPHRFVLDADTDPRVPAGHRAPPPGYRDYATELARYAPAVDPAPLPADGAASVDGTSYRQWGSLGREIAAMVGLHPGDRVLVEVEEYEHPAYWLLAPLAVGATVVLCANLDRTVLAARSAAEGVTRRLEASRAARPTA
ncbi:TIGR03089 family protein [Actinocatenispora rupis]|uniref:AMP-dependent synthetase/ligase domain-containing protein n=1 Tax=Actinocatenispora rupis TaxID=519421 RepID=A0A8J3J245_9ACTN|nr:TIGR03089 family protein [Actinocatenispora rupis]GID10607.1 hypothetical protein Aru02nite_14960 [Actinocatenispora rupis]